MRNLTSDDMLMPVSPAKEGESIDLLRAQIKRLEETLTQDQALIAKLRRKEFDSSLEKLVADGLKAATFKAAPDGKIMVANDHANELCGPVFEQGGNLFSLVIDRLRHPSGIMSEDTGVRSIPKTYGQTLREKIAAPSQVARIGGRARRPSEGFEVECSEMEQLVYESNDGPVRVLMALSYVRDANDHPWIQLTLVNLDAVNRDDLTGLWRRGTFDNVLLRKTEERRRMCDRGGAFAPLTLLMIDIDHFKRVNDTHGHQAGDDALKVVARRIQRVIGRKTDMVCRYGGEEIAAILDADRQEGEMIALRVLREIRDADTVVRTEHGKEALRLTVSIGGTIFTDADDTAWEMIKRADASLYEAKGKGRHTMRNIFTRSRNCVVFDGRKLPDPR
ncbi:MAG TPA: GGDEF domain-containing protein [Candidatus Baltobacteraceae bacterium]|nr:GGDEF domain-containing protein [Candidatus Baltobacteraceae bacterium]